MFATDACCLTLLTTVRLDEGLFTHIDLFVIGFAIFMWVSGILLARKRGISRNLQFIFTLVILGGTAGDILLGLPPHGHIEFPYWVGLVAWLGALVFAGFWLLRKKHLQAYIIFALGMSLVVLPIFFERRLGEQLFYLFFLLGALLLIRFAFIVMRGPQVKTGNGKT